jgi:hypothetical protein
LPDVGINERLFDKNRFHKADLRATSEILGLGAEIMKSKMQIDEGIILPTIICIILHLCFSLSCA